MTANVDRVAVIIVNWNGGELLMRCLDALRRQTRAPDRVVIIDNDSRDDSVARVENRVELSEVIRLGRNAGFAEANNLAVQMVSDCAWVALLNPDAFPRHDWLEQLLAAAGRASGYSFFASLLLKVDDRNGIDGAGDVYHASGAHWRHRHGETLRAIDLQEREIFSPCAAAALYSRDAFLEVGGFDESFFCYAEDLDLGFRLRLAGHRGLYVPQAVVHHMGSALTGRRSDFTVYHGHRNLVWVFVKNVPGPLFWLYLPQHLLFNLVSVLWYGLKGQGRVILRAKWDAIKGLPRVRRERKAIQARRKVGAFALRQLMDRGWLTPYMRR